MTRSTTRRNEVSTMNRSKLVPFAVALMMALPAIVMLGPASAQDIVPFTPNVEWKAQVNHLQSLYLRIAQNNGVPDCRASRTVDQDTTFTPHSLSLFPNAPPSSFDQRDETCEFSAMPGLQSEPPIVSFSHSPLVHGFNVTGNTSLTYVHRGEIPAGVTLRVALSTDRTAIADKLIRGEANRDEFVVTFNLTDEGYRFIKGDVLTVQLQGSAATSGTTGLPTGGRSWTIDDRGATATRLEVRTHDALKVATWVQDEKGAVRDLFRPLDQNVSSDARIVGGFAVRSAFGLEDAREGGAPTFTVTRDGRLVELTSDRIVSLTGQYSASLSQQSDGRAVWLFPSGFWDYRGAQGGEYELTANKPYHQGGAFNGVGITHPFFLSTQSVVVKPFDDRDPNTFPSPLENLAHDVLAGGRTTYVLLVNNTGSVNDTFRLDTTFVSGTPASGWGAEIGGPGVLDGRVSLLPGEEKLVTLTVAAPRGTSVGDNAIHQVRAVSQLDPEATATPVTVISTVSNTESSGVGVIVVGSRTRGIEPGVDHFFDVFAWNRGSRVANLSLELPDQSTAGWTVEFVSGTAGVKQLQLPGVDPGDIARARLKVNGPVSLPDALNEVSLTAKNLDFGGEQTTSITFILKPTSSVKLQVLDQIKGSGHFVEVDSSGAGGTGSLRDGVDGTWWRLWITNTGKRTDNFTVDLDSIEFASVPGIPVAGTPNSGCTDAVFTATRADGTTTHGKDNEGFEVFQRDARGGKIKRNTVELDPAETGELYVWRSTNRGASLCGDPDFFSFVVTVAGRETGAIAREQVTAIAEDRRTNPVSKVLIEGVERTQDYANMPIVNVGSAEKRTITKGVRVGENQTYYVRVTNGASWGAIDSRKSDVVLTLQGVESESGWNVSMRPVNGETNETLNPFGSTLRLVPEANGLRQSFIDHEIEVRVRAPYAANGTALAGEQDQFTITATIPGTSASDVLEIKTVVSEFSDIVLAPETPDFFTRAHPGEPGAYLVYVYNNGSAPADVKLRARVDETTFRADAWNVEPNEQVFTLPAFTNRTVAIRVTPPADAVTGQQARLNISAEYPEFPTTPMQTRNATMDVVAEVTARGTLRVDAPVTETEIAPGGFANFQMTLTNEGGVDLQYRIAASTIPNWDISPSGETVATLPAGESRPYVLVLSAPADVKDNTRFASVVRVSEVGNAANFDVVPVHVTIRGGKAIASVGAPLLENRVDRGGERNFEVAVRNIGTAAAVLPLEVRAQDPDWQVGIQNTRGEPITGVSLGPNELQRINVTVRAPFVLPENAQTKVELTAFSPDFTQSSRVTLTAVVHDYGLAYEMEPSRIEAFAGVPSEFIIRLTNTGNDNDTLNVSANLIDLPEWSVDFSSSQVNLEKGQQAEVRATVKPPKSPLPTPRNYEIRFFASSLGATDVNISKNVTRIGVVEVLEYRSLDVDGDGFLEIAVDQNKRRDDGFETFREPFSDGVQAVVVAAGKLDGKARFFLDVRGENPYDGVADRWFDPESVYSYRIRGDYAVDINGDGSPEYLIDSDRDREAKVDRAYDTVSDAYYNVVQVEVYGDDQLQFLIDTNGDGRPDRFYDPATKKVTRTLPASGANQVGLDTTDDGRVDKYYDTKTGTVTDAKVRNFGEFAAQFWYFFVAFGAMLLVSIVLVARRFRS